MSASWLRRRPKSRSHPILRKPQRLRLCLERLEDRTLLATDLWINSLGGAWATGSNWSLGAPPRSGDDAVIPAYAAGIAIQHASGNDTVHNLTASANLNLSGGSLTVTGT